MVTYKKCLNIPVAKKILLICLGVIITIFLIYLVIFGRALKQAENHLGIALALPRVIINSGVARVDGKTYLARNSSSYIEFMKREGYDFIEQMGAGYLFEKNEQKYIAVSRMYSAHFMVFTISENNRPINEPPLKESEIIFFKTGVASKEPGGANGENLFILYEGPGQLALRRLLKFDGMSFCGDKQRQVVCMVLSVSDYGLVSGRKIQVKGVEKNDVVQVRQLMMME